MSPKVIDAQSNRARELEMIHEALALIAEKGLHTLTMDKLAARLPYSKGTLYNHFQGKEDLLLAVCNESMAVLFELFHRAAQSEGSSRDRMQAVLLGYLIYALQNPVRFQLVLNAKNQGFAGQVQASRLEYHRQLDQSILGVVVKLIQQGIDDQVLQLPKGMNHTQVAFACWSTSFGTITLLLAESDQCGGRSELNIARELLNNSNLLLDGLQWQPLASLRDYKEVSEQLCQSLFLSEVEQLKKEGVLLSF